jgi:DNA-binding NarL/FixJ family response regulator
MHGRRGTPAGPVEPLTPREVEVLRALGEGLSSPEVSQELGITRNTLRTHLHNIMGKLGARSKLEAVLTAIRIGIVEPPRAS